MIDVQVDARLGPDWDDFARDIAVHLAGYATLGITLPEQIEGVVPLGMASLIATRPTEDGNEMFLVHQLVPARVPADADKPAEVARLLAYKINAEWEKHLHG